MSRSRPILYGHEYSPVVRSVFLVAEAIDLDYEYREVQVFAGEHVKDEFLKMNPQHTIPTLDDCGRYLSDSHAISVYLVEKYAESDELYPKNDLYKRACINQRLHFDNGILYDQLRRIVVPMYHENRSKISPDAVEGVHRAYEFMEKFLERDSYLAGNTMTIADLACGANISSLIELISADKIKYPRLNQWFKRICDLPYYQSANGSGNAKYIAMLRDFMDGKIKLDEQFIK